VSQSDSGTPPGIPVTSSRKEMSVELDRLRERMRGLGFHTDEIAAEIARRYRIRPREAYRLAWGWTLGESTARFNEHAAAAEADPEARLGLSGSQLAEIEKWPRSMHKPPVSVLFMLAEIYQTDVLCLLDLADHESLPQPDRLVLLRRPRAATPFAEHVVALMDARGLSAAETARRVECSAGYLCNVLHGRKRPSRRVTARLDDVLEAGGELVALAETAEAVSGDAEPVPRTNLPGHPAGTPAAKAEGLSLSLPYVPARLVIEVSGPAGNSGQLAGDSADHEITSGRLTLVRDTRPTRTKAPGA